MDKIETVKIFDSKMLSSSSFCFLLSHKFNSLKSMSGIFFFLLLISITRSSIAMPTMTDEQNQSTKEKKESKIDLNICDFDLDLKTHQPSDFLRCIDDLSSQKSILKSGKNPATILSDQLNRLVEALEARQESSHRSYSRQRLGPSYGSYDQVPSPPFGAERPADPANYPFEGGFYSPGGFPDYPDSYSPSGLADSALAEALSSISRYDDLKCVPRLLCEISSGSKPGDGDYRALSLADFSKSTLIGLLTSYNFERGSPLLGFAKAALLGYTSRDDPSICYQEYRRCPRDRRDLIHYLNNHNGGFFRFFKNSQRSQTAEGSNRASLARKKPAPPPGLSGPESDRTGTGELKFDTSEPSPHIKEENNRLRSRDGIGSKVVFPNGSDDYTTNNNRVSKSLKSDPAITQGFFPTSNRADNGSNKFLSFFPKDDDRENDDKTVKIVTFESADEEDNPAIDESKADSALKYAEIKERPHRASDADSAFKFPDYEFLDHKVLFDADYPSLRQFPDIQERDSLST